MIQTSHGREEFKPVRTHWLLFAFIVLVFLLSFHTLEFANSERDSLEIRVDVVSQGNPTKQVMFLLLGLCGLAILIGSGSSRPRLVGALAWLILFYVSWTFSSILWAEEVNLTFRRLISFLMFCICALGLSTRLRPRDIGLLMFVSSVVFLFIGIFAEVSLSSFHPMASGYRFSGTQHPNLQAMNCAFLVLSGLYCGDSGMRNRRVFFLAASLGFVFLVLTKSRTSFAATVLAMLAYKSLTSRASRKIVMSYLLIFSIFGVFLLLGGGAGPAVNQGLNLGRDADSTDTLNGRRWLWRECRGYASRHRVLGYGYGGFWSPERIQAVSESQSWTLSSAHSVYWDSILQLGFVGFLLFIGVHFCAIIKARLNFRMTGDVGFAFFAGFLVFFLFHGIMESLFLHPRFVSFMSMVVVASLGFSSGLDEGTE